jgi:DNA-3-methyladenine glycosylase I
MAKKRCAWADTHPLFHKYHDEEWGVPVHNDRLLFEMLNLEGAQAGLSWLIILRKRPTYKKAFDNFDAKKIIKYTAAKKAQLLKNDGIVKNRLKINAVIENAKTYLAVRKEFGSFDKYIWSFTAGKTVKDKKEAVRISEEMSKALKKRGFRFVGPTIIYAFMQAVGMVNDHTKDCFRYNADFKNGSSGS